MLPLISIVGLLAMAENGEADSQCDFGVNVPDSTVWRVDNDINERIDFVDKPNESNDEITAIVNTQLQNFARLSRARFRARAQTAECSGPVACIRARSNGEEGGLCQQGFTAFVRVPGCGVGNNCEIILCEDNINAANPRWGLATLDKVVAHELGHAYSLAHPHASTGLSTLCSAGAFNSPLSPCPGGTSDACEGELMCAAGNCGASAFVTDGDARGLRDRYHGAGNAVQLRKVFFGAEAPPISGQPNVLFPLSPLGASSVYAPRIDCAELTSPTFQCVVIQSSAAFDRPSSIIMSALAGYSSTGWGTIAPAPGGFVQHTFPPDVAISDTGQVAWYVYTTPYPANFAFLVEVNLTASPMTVTAFSLGFRAALPPRVFYNSDLGQPLVLARAVVSGASQSFNKTRWVLKARTGTGIATVDFSVLDDTGDSTESFRQVVADFDVDCRRQSGPNPCVVAVLHHQPNDSAIEGRSIASLEFSVDAFLQVTVGPTWYYREVPIQSVDGLTLSPNRLFVSAALPITAGTETANTRLLEINGTSVAGTLVASTTAVSDAETCSSQTFDGLSLPAFSMWGGTSIAWCPSCDAGGRLLSAHFGRRSDGNNYCF